ncbi:normocyte binding protein 2b [Francisella sp. 19X1-34]|uniref:normocyte binding protein 2b n=1 Tax=Francisella sp. 19X1-34 TaxID=3087177 RepID=UPI002E37A0EA|nr:normocyte binding protein 2b [Francisella sp. 19X1-34]MED7789654.1 normocyte binding protein 2b [Francisella sp. 19X1-34]
MYKSTLVENQQIRYLLSLIKSYYKSDRKEDSIREVNMIYVANRVTDMTVRSHIIESWDNLQIKVGHEIALLEDNCDKSIINKLYRRGRSICFVVKTKPDKSSYDIHELIKKASNIDIIIKEFNMI